MVVFSGVSPSLMVTTAFSSPSELRGPTLASAAFSAEALIVRGVYTFKTNDRMVGQCQGHVGQRRSSTMDSRDVQCHEDIAKRDDLRQTELSVRASTESDVDDPCCEGKETIRYSKVVRDILAGGKDILSIETFGVRGCLQNETKRCRNCEANSKSRCPRIRLRYDPVPLKEQWGDAIPALKYVTPWPFHWQGILVRFYEYTCPGLYPCAQITVQVSTQITVHVQVHVLVSAQVPKSPSKDLYLPKSPSPSPSALTT